MAKKKKDGPHGPGCTCSEEDEKYGKIVDDARDMLSRELLRFTSQKMEELQPSLREDEHVRYMLRDALLVALSLELSHGLVKAGIDLPSSTGFFLRSFEKERSVLLMANARVIGVIPLDEPQEEEEEDTQPDTEAN